MDKREATTSKPKDAPGPHDSVAPDTVIDPLNVLQGLFGAADAVQVLPSSFAKALGRRNNKTQAKKYKNIAKPRAGMRINLAHFVHSSLNLCSVQKANTKKPITTKENPANAQATLLQESLELITPPAVAR